MRLISTVANKRCALKQYFDLRLQNSSGPSLDLAAAFQVATVTKGSNRWRVCSGTRENWINFVSLHRVCCGSSKMGGEECERWAMERREAFYASGAAEGFGRHLEWSGQMGGQIFFEMLLLRGVGSWSFMKKLRIASLNDVYSLTVSKMYNFDSRALHFQQFNF